MAGTKKPAGKPKQKPKLDAKSASDAKLAKAERDCKALMKKYGVKTMDELERVLVKQ